MKATVELRTTTVTSPTMTVEELMDAQRRIYGTDNIVEIGGYEDNYEGEFESVVKVKAWMVTVRKSRKLKWVYE